MTARIEISRPFLTKINGQEPADDQPSEIFLGTPGMPESATLEFGDQVICVETTGAGATHIDLSNLTTESWRKTHVLVKKSLTFGDHEGIPFATITDSPSK